MGGNIVGVVLGAGRSSRFGAPKQLLPFGDTTMLGQVVRNANTSDLDRVVVVALDAAGKTIGIQKQPSGGGELCRSRAG
jgi:CTP:molybdopterin cytidylyltransferase MocA